MTCNNCRFEFCWLCISPWNRHGSCVIPEAQNFQSTDLRKLANCNTKRINMKRSIQLDEKTYKLKMKKQELAVKDKWFKIDFVQEAVDILLSCRRTLADSFVFQYFFENGNDNQWIRSKDNQEKLSYITEDLSHVLVSICGSGKFSFLKNSSVLYF